MEEGEKRKWEWMGHNESNTRRLNEAAPGEEAQIVRNTFATIEQHTGKRPMGWLSSGLAGDLGHARSSRRQRLPSMSPTGATTTSPTR